MIQTLLLAAMLQEPPIEDLYKFKEGSTWTYKRIENGAESKIAGKATGEKEGKVRHEWKETAKDGTSKDSVLTWSVEDGALTVEARSYLENGNEMVLRFPVLKAGSKKGDTWPSAGGEFTHLGTVEVTVPAGSWKNAVKTQLKGGDENHPVKIDVTLVPKVGLVKIEIHDPGGAENRYELTEFKPAK